MTHQKIYFLFFLAVVAGVGVYFFYIVQPYLLPLLMAGTAALLVHPLYVHLISAVGGRRRIAAGLMSAAVIVLFVLPAGAVLAFATSELMQIGEKIAADERARNESLVDIESMPLLDKVEHHMGRYLPRTDVRELRSSAMAIGQSALAAVSKKTTGIIADVVGFAVGFAIMLLGFYYFLAEGPAIADAIERVIPFEPEDEVAVAKKFETICRGVVLGTLAAAVVQSCLLGIATGVLGIPGTWLIICITMVSSMIPILGAGTVYVPVAAYLFWNERYAAAIGLLLYGMLVVSTADNLVRAYMIHGTSRLHPLIGLVSALGAIKLVGLWGIFVGPVVAGVFYALLQILRQKISRLEVPEERPAPPVMLPR